MKQLAINVPTDGTIIVTRRRKRNGDPAQQDCFTSYRNTWMEKMVLFIRSLPRPVRMSEVRQKAAIAGMETALSKNDYGAVMRAAGLHKVGYDISPLKSRRGGVEGLWT